MASTGNMSDLSCHDFGMFQDVLRKMRTLDDRIVNALNTTIPTNSFAGQVNAAGQCKQLFEEVLAGHKEREGLIKHCIHDASDKVNILREKKNESSAQDSVQLLLDLKKEQYRLRMFQSEMNVEDVVRQRTKKVFHERCRLHYMPEEMKL